jgi:hypothetical protein
MRFQELYFFYQSRRDWALSGRLQISVWVSGHCILGTHISTSRYTTYDFTSCPTYDKV